MKTKNIIYVFVGCVVLFYLSCSEDFTHLEEIAETNTNLVDLKSTDSSGYYKSMTSSTWKHGDVSATNKHEADAWVTVGPDGTVHFAFIKETKREKINGNWYPTGWDVFYRNVAGGQMSAITQLTFLEAERYSYPSVAVDPFGIVHIVVQLKTSTDCGLFYLNNMGGQFSLVEQYWDPSFGECFNGFGWSWIDVDANGKVHMVSKNRVTENSEEFFYATNIGGSFEFRNINTTGLQSFGYLFLDEKDGIVHLAFSASLNANDYNYDIYYEKQVEPDGSFSAPMLVANVGDRDDYPGIKVGDDGYVHITHDLDYENGVYYSNNVSGSFTTEQVKGPGFFGADFVLLSDNSIGIHMSENSDGILYVHNANGFWETEEVVPPGDGQCVCFSSSVTSGPSGYVHMTNVRSQTVGKGNRQTTNRDVVYHTNDPNFQAGGGIMHVEAIDMSLKQKGPNWNAIADVLVFDGDLNPVSGATVTGEWSGLVTGAGSSITEDDGYATINSPKTKETGTFTFTVTNVTKDGYTYDPNGETEMSISN